MRNIKNIIRLFNPYKRDAGMWAFSLNRITGIGLTIYLYLHLFVLRKIAQGPEEFNQFIQLAQSPWYVAGELLVIIAVLLHGLNGIRIALTSFGIAVPYQKQIYYVVILLTIFASILIGIKMVQ